MFPGCGLMAAKLAFNPLKGAITPSELGPMIRMSGNRAAAASTRSSSARPSAPTSRNPADRMMIPRIPASPHSWIKAGTPGAGVQITARSTAASAWPMCDTAGNP